MEDKEIIELFFRRDESAIEHVGGKYGTYCRSIAMNILSNRESSEECVNDTWLRLWQAIPPQSPVSLRAFAGRITRNLSLNVLRGMSQGKRGGGQTALSLDELDECIPELKTPEKAAEDAMVIRALNRWLEGLEAEQRVAFIRRYWYFDSLDAVAQRMGWTRSKTNSLLGRLRVRLRKYLESEDIRI